MEFLMTYGWAVLAVLVTLAALVYFDVLNPTSLLPERCSLPSGFVCADHVVSDQGIGLKIQNSAGKDATIAEIRFFSSVLAGDCGTGPINGILRAGETKLFVATDPAACGLVGEGKKNNFDVMLTYSWLTHPSLMHTDYGELFSGIESGVDVGELEGIDNGYVGHGSLVSYWRLDESSGDVARDSVLNDGSLNGFSCTSLDCNPDSGWTSSGKIGNALMFDRNDDYVEVAASESLNQLTNNFTVMAWINTKSGCSQTQSVVEKTVGGAVNTHFSMFVYSTGGTWFRVEKGGSLYTARSDSCPSTNTWTHITGIYNGAEVSVWVNGVKQGWVDNVTAPIDGGSGTLEIGKNPSATYFFNGKIDEVRIWDRALSAQEVSALYAAER